MYDALTPDELLAQDRAQRRQPDGARHRHQLPSLGRRAQLASRLRRVADRLEQ